MAWNNVRSLLRGIPGSESNRTNDLDGDEQNLSQQIAKQDNKEWIPQRRLCENPHTKLGERRSLDFLTVPAYSEPLRRTSSVGGRIDVVEKRGSRSASLLSATCYNDLGGSSLGSRERFLFNGSARGQKRVPVREIFGKQSIEDLSAAKFTYWSQSGEGADGEKETLHSLARRGNTQEIRVLLQQNEDIDKRDSYGKTPLHCAVSAGQLAAVKYLLHCHANPNLKDHREEAPLHAAVRTGNVDVVEALLNHKATNVNIEGRNKYTPLHIAAYLEHRNALEICQKLLDGGANVTLRGSDHMTPLSVATMKGAHETMELFFKKSHELQNDPKKSMDILYSVDYEGSTLLHLAIDSGSLKAVLLCLDQGCSLTAIRRVDGGSPIHLACRLGALDIVQCLHQHDPSTFISILLDREGMTPLHRAAMFNHEGVVRFIIEQGLDLNPRDKEKCTPLLLAAAHGCSNVVSLLLDKGADVSCKDDKNRTALHWAVGQDKTIEGLLDDPRVQSLQLVNDQDSTGSTTLHYAAQGGFLKSVLLLLKNGADPSLKNHKLETPLHLAASHGWLPIVKKLMEGRQTRLMNVGNLSDHTPLHLAASNGQEKVVKFLLDRGATIERYGQKPLETTLWFPGL